MDITLLPEESHRSNFVDLLTIEFIGLSESRFRLLRCQNNRRDLHASSRHDRSRAIPRGIRSGGRHDFLLLFIVVIQFKLNSRLLMNRLPLTSTCIFDSGRFTTIRFTTKLNVKIQTAFTVAGF